MASECKEDIDKWCASVPQNLPRLRECLAGHKEELSDQCQAFVAKFAPPPAHPPAATPAAAVGAAVGATPAPATPAGAAPAAAAPAPATAKPDAGKK